jgi:hypothetical protein
VYRGKLRKERKDEEHSMIVDLPTIPCQQDAHIFQPREFNAWEHPWHRIYPISTWIDTVPRMLMH